MRGRKRGNEKKNSSFLLAELDTGEGTEKQEFCSLEEGREWRAEGAWSGRGLEEDEFYCDTWTR